MKFQRIPTRRLPNGDIAAVYPFHICTKGEKVVFRNTDDLRMAFNFLPICALRSNVIIVIQCVLNTHFHCIILARSYEDARSFGNCFKKSVSMCLARTYGIKLDHFRDVDSKPILLEDDRYLRNAICYVLANALDAGGTVDSYPWSGYRALFCGGCVSGKVSKVSDMTRRMVRKILRADINLKNVSWMINDQEVLEPASFCDWRYVEDAFYGDISFFTRILGITDRDQMDCMMIEDHLKRKSLNELKADVEERCMRRYGKTIPHMTRSQKIPILKLVNHTNKASVKMLARCFEMPDMEVSTILKRTK